MDDEKKDKLDKQITRDFGRLQDVKEIIEEIFNEDICVMLEIATPHTLENYAKTIDFYISKSSRGFGFKADITYFWGEHDLMAHLSIREDCLLPNDEAIIESDVRITDDYNNGVICVISGYFDDYLKSEIQSSREYYKMLKEVREKTLLGYM